MNVNEEIVTIEEIKTGTIKSVLEKGYGFITDEDEGNDIFFHVTGCVEPKFNDLREGMKVNYLLSTRNDKPIAIGIVGI